MDKIYNNFDIISDNIFTKNNNKIINNYKKSRFVLTKLLHRFFLDNKYEQSYAIILKETDSKFGFGYNESGLEIKNENSIKFVTIPSGTFFYNTVATLPETNVNIDTSNTSGYLIFRQSKLYFDVNLKENDITLYKFQIENNKIIPQINISTENFYSSDVLYCKDITAKKIFTDVINAQSQMAKKTTINNSTILKLQVEKEQSDSNKNTFKLSKLAGNYIELTNNGLSINKNKNVPIGTILPSLQTEQELLTFLPCDGRTLNKNNYKELFNVIGHTYGGSGDEFKLPDLRELTLVGACIKDGEKNITNQITNHDTYKVGEFKDDQIQNHTHKYDKFNHHYRDDGWYPDKANVIIASDKETTATIDAYSNNKVRTGSTTHGKQFGVNFYIKAYN